VTTSATNRAASVALDRAGLQSGLAVSCRALHHVYHLDGEEVVALESVDLTIRGGESVALLGPSGSGKSTLLTLLAGLLRPTSGQLYIGGEDIARMTERELLALRAQRVGVVVQGPSRNLLPYGTAEDNIAFAQRAVRGSRRADLPVPADLLDQLGLHDLSGQVVGRMSGGESQRLAVAVALAGAPGLLLADEPTSQLDRPNRDRVVELLRTVTRRFGTTLVAVTHDADVAQALGRTVTIVAGRADDHGQRREQFVQVSDAGSVQLPADVLAGLPPGSIARIVRKPDGVELVRHDDDEDGPGPVAEADPGEGAP
jgi:ABC-type lipoprotein export system ATPase subunit